MIWEDGTSWKGQFLNGVVEGEGLWISGSGEQEVRYQGYISAGLFEGQGACR